MRKKIQKTVVLLLAANFIAGCSVAGEINIIDEVSEEIKNDLDGSLLEELPTLISGEKIVTSNGYVVTATVGDPVDGNATVTNGYSVESIIIE